MQAFEVFGGVPTGKIRYDNLKPAVLRVLLGRERLENPQFIALRSHYGFDSFFCQPGQGRRPREGRRGRGNRPVPAPAPDPGADGRRRWRS